MIISSNNIYILASVISSVIGLIFIFCEVNINIPFKKQILFFIFITLFIPSNIIVRSHLEFYLYLNNKFFLSYKFSEFIFKYAYSPLGVSVFLGINYSPLSIFFFRKLKNVLDKQLFIAALYRASFFQRISCVFFPLIYPYMMKNFCLIYLASLGNIGIPLVLTNSIEDCVVSTFLYKNLFTTSPKTQFQLNFILFTILILIGFFFIAFKEKTVLENSVKPYKVHKEINYKNLFFFFIIIFILYLAPILTLLIKSILFLINDFFYYLDDMIRFSYLSLYINAFINSFKISFLASLMIQFICVVNYLNFNIARPNVLFTFIVAIPGTLWAASLALAFSSFDIYGTLWLIGVCYVTKYMGFNDLMFSNYLKSQLSNVMLYQKTLILSSKKKIVLLFKNSFLILYTHFLIIFLWLISETSMSAILSKNQQTLGWLVINLEQSGEHELNFCFLAISICIILILHFFVKIFTNGVYDVINFSRKFKQKI